jgi:hypothetical protein
VYEIRRDASGQFPDAAFDYFEGRYNGIYTAIFSPGGETMYLESTDHPQSNYLFGFDYLQHGNNYKNFRAQQFIERILQLERENDSLKSEVEDLTEQLSQFSTLSGKFEHALINIFTNNVLPFFAGQQQQQPMQGMVNNNNNNTMSWTERPIIVPGQEEQALDNALDVIIEAFGEQNIIKMAQRLQSQPHLVTTLTSML